MDTGPNPHIFSAMLWWGRPCEPMEAFREKKLRQWVPGLKLLVRMGSLVNMGKREEECLKLTNGLSPTALICLNEEHDYFNLLCQFNEGKTEWAHIRINLGMDIRTAFRSVFYWTGKTDFSASLWQILLPAAPDEKTSMWKHYFRIQIHIIHTEYT